MIKFSEFITEAGASAERQEYGFIYACTQFYSNVEKPFTLKTKGETIKNVIGCDKVEGTNSLGKEPYTDVIIKTAMKQYNVSMKGSSAPSLAGGGAAGIDQIIPGFLKGYLDRALAEILKKGYKDGDKIPDIFFKID
jgi:hypothetical protein